MKVKKKFEQAKNGGPNMNKRKSFDGVLSVGRAKGIIEQCGVPQNLMKANNRSLISEVPEMLVSNAPSVREGKEVHQVRDIIH